MDTLSEKHTGGTVQLGYHHPFSTVDNEYASLGHVRDRPQVHILDHRIKIFVFRICAIKLQLGLQRNTVGQSPFDTLINGIPGWIDGKVEKLQHKIVPGICDGKILLEYPVQTFVFSVLGCGFHLKEIMK